MVESCFPISRAERKRIAVHAQRLGKPDCIQAPNSEYFLHGLHRLFPGERQRIGDLFPRNGVHYRLALAADGSCVFLGTQGCLLPDSDRPHYCRIYPFWFINTTLFTFSSRQCLAVNRCSSTAELCALFKTDPSGLRSLYDALRHAWGLSPDEPR